MNPFVKDWLRSVGIGAVIGGILLIAFGGLVYTARTLTNERVDKDDWYLVCSGKDKDYLVKSDQKPYTKDGFIYIDGESFITAEAGMTCKPVKGDVVRAAIGQKGLEQGN